MPLCCITDYLSQGSTLSEVIADLETPPRGKTTTQNQYIPTSRCRRKADFALWRPFKKHVLENMKVQQDLLDDQARLRAKEANTFKTHANILMLLATEVAPDVAQIAKKNGTPFDSKKFTTTLQHLANYT